MIQVDLQNVRSFIPLPYEAALSPRCLLYTSPSPRD